MSSTAQKRDLADPQTIQDFVGRVKSLERLRLLYLLTVVDIRAVGPGTWNSWKDQLLANLFEAAEEVLRLGHKQQGREANGSPRSSRIWRPRSAGKAIRRRPMPAASPTAIGWPSRRRCSPATPRSWRAVDAAQGRRRRSSWCRSRTAAPPWSRSTRATSRACSTASPARSACRAATSSTRASTPPPTAWRSTICWSRTPPAARSPTRAALERSWTRRCATAVAGQEPSIERLEARALPLVRAEAFSDRAGGVRR